MLVGQSSSISWKEDHVAVERFNLEPTPLFVQSYPNILKLIISGD